MSSLGNPDTVLYCQRCVISNQRPSSSVEFISDFETKKRTIAFDDNQICEACRYHEIKSLGIDWTSRENELAKLAEQIRSSRSSMTGYDIVVPGSGGKDSAYTAHILKYQFGLNPLTVTWAPHLYTEIGWKNFVNWSHVGGLDNLLFTPNGKLHRYLTKLAFLNLLHPFQPFIVGQRIVGPRIAAKFGIKHVFYGENQAEYGNAIGENKSPLMHDKFFSLNNFKELKLGGLAVDDITTLGNFSLEDITPYMPLSTKESSQVEVHYLGYYLRWDPQECFYYAFENTGFRPNDERTQGSYSKYSSIDDKIDPFHYYTTLIKFGLGRATYDAAQEIRNGKITRDEGVALVKKFDQEFPDKYFAEFLDYISLSEMDFLQTIDRFRPMHLWDKTGSGWTLKKPVWLSS
jgi:N-acetyl sugar amidotransferase